MSESNNDTPPEGTAGGDTDIMRAIVLEGAEDPRSAALRVRLAMDRANDTNAARVPPPTAQRAEQPPISSVARVETHLAAKRGDTGAADPADPSKPVVGILDLIEDVVATTQRYGAFAHWPSEKKSEVLGLVTRTVKQHAIAEQVLTVTRRDSLHARAYRERRRLAREAATLTRTYYKFDVVQPIALVDDVPFYTEALNYLGRFAAKVAALPETPGEESGE